jgi:hypothetical protein
MTLVLADRVKDSTTTTGTGTVTLSGTAPTGYQTFGAGVGDGNTTYYTISGGLEWEVGIGTYTAAGTTLSRSTVISSSNAGSLVTFSAGTKDVFVTYPASRAMPLSQFSYSTTATAAGTTTLVASSNYLQYFTGATTQTIVLPVTSTLSLGWSYHICNNSTGNLTVQSSGANTIATVIPGTTIHVTCILVTGTTAASWDFGITDFENRTGTGSVVLGTGPTITAGVYNGTVGATTANTGVFTTLTASTNISSTRINPRISSATSASTFVPNGDGTDQYNITALAVPTTIAAPSGTPVNGQKLTLRIVDNGTARALTWTTTSGAYRIVGTTLPTTTVASKTIYVGCIYNAEAVFWDVVAVTQQA